jgi:hypothetical protein
LAASFVGATPRSRISRLLNYAREVRDRLFVDGRRLTLSLLPDLKSREPAQPIAIPGASA